MTRILVAVDKFKGSATGTEVAQALSRGLRSALPDPELVVVPTADGGDGTLDAAVASGMRRVPVRCSGPTGEPVESGYAVRGDLAVVEMADACGLLRLPGGRPAPITASSRGLGEVIAAALDAGARRILVGIGGSASTDGGAGLLHALGARIWDDEIDLSGLHPALAGAELTVACDVSNPLTGADGAAAVFGPQKGAAPGQVRKLEARLRRFADLVADAAGTDLRDLPGAGAAGGAGFALAVLGATMRPGVELVLELNDFAARLSGSGLVLTGEGRLDTQTLAGKAPAGVARAAVAAGVPVVAVCGLNELAESDWRAAGFAAVHALTELEPDVAVCRRDAVRLLEDMGRLIAGRYCASDT